MRFLWRVTIVSFCTLFLRLKHPHIDRGHYQIWCRWRLNHECRIRRHCFCPWLVAELRDGREQLYQFFWLEVFDRRIELTGHGLVCGDVDGFDVVRNF